MKMIVVGVSSLFLFACGANVVVGDAGGGSSGSSGSPPLIDNPGSGGLPVGPDGAGAASGYTGDFPDAGADGGPVYTWTDPTTAPGCTGSPLSVVSYSTTAELDTLFVGQWRRCVAPQFPGEDVGVEFTADGNYYPLTFDSSHHVVRRVGVDYQGTWTYYPPGSVDELGVVPDGGAFSFGTAFDSVVETTSPPQFLLDPQQMRITFSPVLSKYVALTP